MARQWINPDGWVVDEDGTEEYLLPSGSVLNEDQAAAPATTSLPPFDKKQTPVMKTILAR